MLRGPRVLRIAEFIKPTEIKRDLADSQVHLLRKEIDSFREQVTSTIASKVCEAVAAASRDNAALQAALVAMAEWLKDVATTVALLQKTVPPPPATPDIPSGLDGLTPLFGDSSASGRAGEMNADCASAGDASNGSVSQFVKAYRDHSDSGERDGQVLDTSYALQSVVQPIVALHVVPTVWMPLEPPMILDRNDVGEDGGPDSSNLIMNCFLNGHEVIDFVVPAVVGPICCDGCGRLVGRGIVHARCLDCETTVCLDCDSSGFLAALER